MKQQSIGYTLALLVLVLIHQESWAFINRERRASFSGIGRATVTPTFVDVFEVRSSFSPPSSSRTSHTRKYYQQQFPDVEQFQAFIGPLHQHHTPTITLSANTASLSTTAETAATTTSVGDLIDVCSTTLVRLSSWFENAVRTKFDKKKVAKVGVSFALTYSMISNVNGSISLSVAWYIASLRTGLSPLAPGNWKSLLAAYGGLYLFITLMRPLRVALAMALTKKTDAFLDSVQSQLNCSRPTAIGVQAALSILLWIGCIAGGVSAASAMSGVPIFP